MIPILGQPVGRALRRQTVRWRLVAILVSMALVGGGAQAQSQLGAAPLGPAPSCLHAEPKSHGTCDNNDGMIIEAINRCDRALDVQICIGLRNGKVSCGLETGVQPGHSTSYSACQPNKRYGVRARLNADAGPPKKAACPDEYFRSAETGECVKCEGIWADGQCIYD
jgi:hypothetical protein